MRCRPRRGVAVGCVAALLLLVVILSSLMAGEVGESEAPAPAQRSPQQHRDSPVHARMTLSEGDRGEESDLSDLDYPDQIQLLAPQHKPQNSYNRLRPQHNKAVHIVPIIRKSGSHGAGGTSTTVPPVKTGPVVGSNTSSVRVAFTAVGVQWGRQATVMMKSMLMFTSHTVHFKAFTDQKAANYIQTRVHQFAGRLRRRCDLVFYDLTVSFTIIQGLVPDIPTYARMDSHPGNPLKPLIPALFPNLDSILILDTDILFLSDVTSLYDTLPQFSANQMMGMGEEGILYTRPQNTQKFPTPYGLNTGVILVDIVKTRKSDFLSIIMNYHNTRSHEITSSHHYTQGLLNLYFSDHPDQVYPLSCRLTFHAGVDACSYTWTDPLRRRCVSAGANGAAILHGTSGRFTLGKNISDVDREDDIDAVATVNKSKQREYGRLYRMFDRVNAVDMTWRHWDGILSEFLSIRRAYCDKRGQEYSYGLLRTVKKALMRVLT